MSKFVINFLEIVEIEDNDGQWISASFGTRNFLSETLFTEPAIVQSSKWIENRKTVEPVSSYALLVGSLQLFG